MTQVVWTPKANESYTSEEREITRPGTPACTGLGQFKKSPANSPARGGGHFVRLLEAAPDASAIGAAKITANRGMTVLQTVALPLGYAAYPREGKGLYIKPAGA